MLRLLLAALDFCEDLQQVSRFRGSISVCTMISTPRFSSCLGAHILAVNHRRAPFFKALELTGIERVLFGSLEELPELLSPSCLDIFDLISLL
jgi:hypothetical protein